VVAEQLLPGHVASMPFAAFVIGTVVLTDETGHRVEKVRVAEEAAPEVEHGLVAQGRRQPEGQPDQTQPGLPRRAAVVDGQRECAPREWDTGEAVATGSDVGGHQRDRDQPCGGGHLDGLYGVEQGPHATHLVEDRPLDGRHRDAVDHGAFAGWETLTADCRPRVPAQVGAAAEHERDRQPTRAAGRAVEECGSSPT
jgi:hypothetical protein